MCQVYILDNVREYAEGYGVEVAQTAGEYDYSIPEKNWKGRGRLVVRAYNEGKFNFTEVDLVDLLIWVKKKLPDIWSGIE